jgi:predicted lipoprotein with Yx(FWY)xxD motif
MNRSIAIAATALAATAALALTACSSSGGSGGGPTTSPVAATANKTVTVAIVHGNLVAPDGHTLYANTADSPSHLICTGQCLQIWPPLYGTPKAGTGVKASALGTIKRGSNSQVTFNGHPLYEFSGDSSAGSMRGNGVTDAGGTWHSLGSAVSSVGTPPAPSTGHSAAPKGGYGSYP